MNKWQEIWQKRELDPNRESTQTRLLTADGFDTLGGVGESVWQDYVHKIVTRLRLTPESSVFEVGCGSGAFLYPLYMAGYSVAGIDYAGNLVKIAQEAMPGSRISASAGYRHFHRRQFDTVLSMGVFALPEL